MSEWTDTIQERLGSRAKIGAPLAGLTTFGIGGPAELLAHVESIIELLWLKETCRTHNVPMRVLGGGSNLLIPDEGLPGVTALLEGEMEEVKIDGGTGKVKAGAGAVITRVAARCSDAGLTGLEWASGLPGTVGGAIAGNAGAWGECVADTLVSVRLLERSGRVSETPKEKLIFEYRRSSIPESGAIVLAGTFVLKSGDRESIRDKCDEVKRKRRETQPVGEKSAGSVFKNPPGDAAGRLLDASGCKGLRVGEAMVSAKHANIIVNAGHATAKDVKELIAEMQLRAQKQFNVALELEIKVL